MNPRGNEKQHYFSCNFFRQKQNLWDENVVIVIEHPCGVQFFPVFFSGKEAEESCKTGGEIRRVQNDKHTFFEDDETKGMIDDRQKNDFDCEKLLLHWITISLHPFVLIKFSKNC